MTEETLKVYAPCPTHRLWHDLETKCAYCTYFPDFEAAVHESLGRHEAHEPVWCDRCGGFHLVQVEAAS